MRLSLPCQMSQELLGGRGTLLPHLIIPVLAQHLAPMALVSI